MTQRQFLSIRGDNFWQFGGENHFNGEAPEGERRRENRSGFYRGENHKIARGRVKFTTQSLGFKPRTMVSAVDFTASSLPLTFTATKRFLL